MPNIRSLGHRWWFRICFYFYPDPRGNDPGWFICIIQPPSNIFAPERLLPFVFGILHIFRRKLAVKLPEWVNTVCHVKNGCRKWKLLISSFDFGKPVATPLKNVLVKMGSSSPRFRVKIPKIFELPPPRMIAHLPKNLGQISHKESIQKSTFFWILQQFWWDSRWKRWIFLWNPKIPKKIQTKLRIISGSHLDICSLNMLSQVKVWFGISYSKCNLPGCHCYTPGN